MPVAESPFLVPWANFYILLGSSAAAMTGLMFIVITLVAQIEAIRRSPDGIAVFSTPTVVHLCAALLGSAILSAPWHSLGHAAAMLGLTGVCGLVYVIGVLVRMNRWTTYRPVLEDWVWYGIFPLVAYLTMVGAAIRLPAVPTSALFPLAGALLLLIFIGIHNSWDIVTTIVVGRLFDPPAAPPKDDD